MNPLTLNLKLYLFQVPPRGHARHPPVPTGRGDRRRCPDQMRPILRRSGPGNDSIEFNKLVEDHLLYKRYKSSFLKRQLKLFSRLGILPFWSVSNFLFAMVLSLTAQLVQAGLIPKSRHYLLT